MLDGLGDFGSKIMKGLHEHSNMLMALGAGMMGAPNLAQGMSRGLSFAVPGHEADIKQGLLQSNQSTAYNALLSMGVPQHLAAAGATDPEMRKSLLDAYMAPKMEIKEVKTKNSWGEEQTEMYAVDPRNPKNGYNVLTGQPIGGGEASGGRTIGTLPSGMAQDYSARPDCCGTGWRNGCACPCWSTGRCSGDSLPWPERPGLQHNGNRCFMRPASTIESFDHGAVGPDYLKQFSPEVQAQIMDRVTGLQSATGARGGGAMIQARINQAAEKYGRDIGMPMDGASVAARMKYAKDLVSEQPGTAGGKRRALQQGLEHFVALSDGMVDLNLSGGLGIEKLARGANWLKSGTTAQQEKIATVQSLGDRLAGEMGQLTSSAGGSKGEREKTAQLVSDAFGSGKKAAGALKGIIDIMQGGLHALEYQRDSIFPPDSGTVPRGADFYGPDARSADGAHQKEHRNS